MVHLKWQVTQVKYCRVISGNGNTISGRNRAIRESQIELKQDLCLVLLCCHCVVTRETKAEQVEKGGRKEYKAKSKTKWVNAKPGR